MDNKKQILKFILGGLTLLFIVFITLYCATVFYNGNQTDNNNEIKNNEINSDGTNLGLILKPVKQLFSDVQDDQIDTRKNSQHIGNIDNDRIKNSPDYSVSQTQNNMRQNDQEDFVIEISNGNALNRKLLNECLAKAENEWLKLRTHYQIVLTNCIDLNLGLNGEKLFSAEECGRQIAPAEARDRQRIQADKNECFARYSERQ